MPVVSNYPGENGDEISESYRYHGFPRQLCKKPAWISAWGCQVKSFREVFPIIVCCPVGTGNQLRRGQDHCSWIPGVGSRRESGMEPAQCTSSCFCALGLLGLWMWCFQLAQWEQSCAQTKQNWFGCLNHTKNIRTRVKTLTGILNYSHTPQLIFPCAN